MHLIVELPTKWGKYESGVWHAIKEYDLDDRPVAYCSAAGMPESLDLDVVTKALESANVIEVARNSIISTLTHTVMDTACKNCLAELVQRASIRA